MLQLQLYKLIYLFVNLYLKIVSTSNKIHNTTEMDFSKFSKLNRNIENLKGPERN